MLCRHVPNLNIDDLIHKQEALNTCNFKLYMYINPSLDTFADTSVSFNPNGAGGCSYQNQLSQESTKY